MKTAVYVNWFSEELQPDGSTKLLPQSPQLFGATASFPALVVETVESRRVVPFDRIRRYGRAHGRFVPDEPRLNSAYVSSYAGSRTSSLGALWDKVSLSDQEREVIAALKIVDPAISGVSMIGGEDSRRGRSAIVRSAGFSRPVPLRSLGDGVSRLFSIALSLVNAKGGLLLIDEFENGMHHTVQADAWRMIFRVAKALDVQVFVTSHSWDAVQAFQAAAAETPEEGVLVRLTRKGASVFATVFRQNELSIATRDQIEVR